jgi:hypothetical protein
MKDQSKSNDKTPVKKPKVKVTIQLKKVPPVMGYIEMSCHIEGGGIVRQAASPKPAKKEEKKVPPNQKETTTPAQILVQDTDMRPEYEKVEYKTV